MEMKNGGWHLFALDKNEQEDLSQNSWKRGNIDKANTLNILYILTNKLFLAISSMKRHQDYQLSLSA